MLRKKHEPVLERRCICVFVFAFALVLGLAALGFGGVATAMLTVDALIMSASRGLGGMADICILRYAQGRGTCVEMQAGRVWGECCLY